MGSLEPEEGREGSPLNLANALTLSRFVLAPVFLVLYVRGEELRALAAFAAAAATDVLDGLVARALRQHTRLGAFLDPIADKFLFACALVALAAAGRLPVWLPVLVVARDLAQLLGAGLLRGTHHVVPVAPTRIGKYASAGLAATVVLAMAEGFGPMPPAAVLAPYVAAAGLLAAECVALSFAQYVYFFARTLRAAPGR